MKLEPFSLVDFPTRPTKFEFVQRRINFDDRNSSIEKIKKSGSLKDKTCKKKALEKTPG